MRRYVIRRLLQMIPTILAILLFNFFLIRLAPGDPARAMAGEMADPANVEALRVRFGLDKPLSHQLVIYLTSLARGDLGYSFAYLSPVSTIVGERIPRTAFLMLTSLALAVLMGIALGTFAASRFPSAADSFISISSVAAYSMPVFWFGLILIFIFAIRLEWLPSGGMISFTQRHTGLAYYVDVGRHAILPIIVLAVYNVPLFLRITRASVVETMREEFITTARGIGLSERRVFFRHGLRNALLPTVTMIGLSLGFVLTGAILTESVFGWPGIGRLLGQAISNRDYPTMQGIFLLSSVAVVVASFLTDLTYAVLDPRVRFE